MPVITLDPKKKAAIDRAKALEAVDVWFSSALFEGFATEDGWKLGLSEQDVALLTGAFVLAKEADALGIAIPPVIDRSGTPRTFETLAEMTAVMAAYGQHRAALSAEYASRKAAIESPQE